MCEFVQTLRRGWHGICRIFRSQNKCPLSIIGAEYNQNEYIFWKYIHLSIYFLWNNILWVACFVRAANFRDHHKFNINSITSVIFIRFYQDFAWIWLTIVSCKAAPQIFEINIFSKSIAIRMKKKVWSAISWAGDTISKIWAAASTDTLLN